MVLGLQSSSSVCKTLQQCDLKWCLWICHFYCLWFVLLQVLESYGKEWIIEIRDITSFVCEQYEHVNLGELDKLQTAGERVYPITDVAIAQQLEISDFQG